MSLSLGLQIEFNTLFRNLGNWSWTRKALLGGTVACLLLVLGNTFYLDASRERLRRLEARETALQQQSTDKAGLAGNLEVHALELDTMRSAFAQMLQQLPTDTEVPSLLEDITRLGLASGLVFEEIRLLEERVQPLYIELPIQIGVIGVYHDLAMFVSAMAGLSRIVTSHDLAIRPVGSPESPLLRLDLLAKTYRYNLQGIAP